MKNLYRFIKNIKLKRILTVLLASSLLVISTACSSSDVAQGKSAAVAANSDTYDKYDREESYQGGMNSYNDDRRYRSGNDSNSSKVRELIDTAERRKADNLGEFGDNVVERSVANDDVNERALNKFSNKLDRNKDKAAEYIDNKSDKLGRNIQKLPNQAKNAVEGGLNTAQNAAQDAAEATKSTAKNIKGNFKDLT